MSDDPMYPQYRIAANWTEDGDDGVRRDNAVSLDRMYREDPGADEVLREVREWWSKYVKAERRLGGKPVAERNPSEPEIEVRHRGEESWCLRWFEHWTFDVGQSDDEALDSFERYVRRYEHMQDPLSVRDLPDDYRCLMGAEDRWRWCGGSSPDERTAPPCRCEHCREQGVIRIGH